MENHWPTGLCWKVSPPPRGDDTPKPAHGFLSSRWCNPNCQQKKHYYTQYFSTTPLWHALVNSVGSNTHYSPWTLLWRIFTPPEADKKCGHLCQNTKLFYFILVGQTEKYLGIYRCWLTTVCCVLRRDRCVYWLQTGVTFSTLISLFFCLQTGGGDWGWCWQSNAHLSHLINHTNSFFFLLLFGIRGKWQI